MRNKHEKLVTIFGGSGFVGRNIVQQLSREGYRIRVASRRPELSNHLQPSGSVNQIHYVQANIRYPETVTKAIHGSDIVINLCGVLFEHGKQNYDEVHIQGVSIISKAAKVAHVKQLIHFSAINSTPQAEAEYSRTKAKGELEVKLNFPKATIIRPSVIFGKHDNFFNLFADLARISPALPLIGYGKTKMQPVYVGDIAKAVSKILDKEITSKTFELGGPDVKTLKQIFQYILKITGRNKLLIPLPFTIAKAWAWCWEIIPLIDIITVDQVKMLQDDNVVSKDAIDRGRTLKGLGIEPTSFNSIVPTYLIPYRKKGQFNNNFRHSKI